MAEKTANQDASGENRRQYERVKVSQPIKLEATLRGRFIDIMRLEMSGMTIDMSNGGFCANVDQSISPGVRCRVELASKDGDEPKSLWGRVRRTTNTRGGYVVALEFDEPVEAAEMLGAADLAGDEAAVLEVAEDEGTGVFEAVRKAPANKRKVQRKRKKRVGKKKVG